MRRTGWRWRWWRGRSYDTAQQVKLLHEVVEEGDDRGPRVAAFDVERPDRIAHREPEPTTRAIDPHLDDAAELVDLAHEPVTAEQVPQRDQVQQLVGDGVGVPEPLARQRVRRVPDDPIHGSRPVEEVAAVGDLAPG